MRRIRQLGGQAHNLQLDIIDRPIYIDSGLQTTAVNINPREYMMACKYEGCNEPVNSPHDEELCVFHAPKENKGITVEEFNDLIWQKQNSRCFNFRGFIFPGDIFFRGECKKSGGPIVFAKDTDFSAVQFLGKADFIEAQFSGYADFSKAQFSGDTDFINVQFSGDADFSEAQFHSETNFSHSIFNSDVDFSNVKFKGNDNIEKTDGDLNLLLYCVRFLDTTFKKRAIFHATVFYKYSDFSDTKYFSKADFNGAMFFDKGIFHSTQFGGKTHFVANQIYEGLDFTDIIFSERATFYFGAPIGQQKQSGRGVFTVISFNHVKFKAFDTFFEKIPIPFQSFKVIKELLNEISFIFRYCELQDVYFTNVDLSSCSFFESSFEKARFISCKWSFVKDYILFKWIKVDRKNVILEEKLLEDIRDHKNDEKYIEKLKSNNKIEYFYDYEDIATLYRRMKTALDNTKDYQQASWFYFNEFEMKRKALKDDIKIEKERLKRLLMSGRLLLYNIYKTLAGYGEKPMWSFIWFGLLTIIFTAVNFLNGLKVSVNEVVNNVNYNISLTGAGFSTLLKSQFWHDLGNAALFTLYRVIPVGYLPFHRSKYEPIGLDGLSLSFVNSVVLILLVVFIAIGLKRHFRRF